MHILERQVKMSLRARATVRWQDAYKIIDGRADKMVQAIKDVIRRLGENLQTTTLQPIAMGNSIHVEIHNRGKCEIERVRIQGEIMIQHFNPTINRHTEKQKFEIDIPTLIPPEDSREVLVAVTDSMPTFFSNS